MDLAHFFGWVGLRVTLFGGLDMGQVQGGADFWNRVGVAGPVD